MAKEEKNFGALLQIKPKTEVIEEVRVETDKTDYTEEIIKASTSPVALHKTPGAAKKKPEKDTPTKQRGRKKLLAPWSKVTIGLGIDSQKLIDEIIEKKALEPGRRLYGKRDAVEEAILDLHKKLFSNKS